MVSHSSIETAIASKPTTRGQEGEKHLNPSLLDR